MKFIKKNGKVVSFQPSKIKTSVENAGSDVGIHLNSKELDLIISDVESILVSLSREITTGYEVRSIVVEALIKYGYKNIAKSYMLNIL
ncbi:ATP cone domain-containing protein [Clostridium subterminale]|uniref:ATP-cone domain-containing protein n=1 Tax=Clostridium subterminale TaxID=1550 RepID=A0ABN1KWA5_CLOSU